MILRSWDEYIQLRKWKCKMHWFINESQRHTLFYLSHGFIYLVLKNVFSFLRAQYKECWTVNRSVVDSSFDSHPLWESLGMNSMVIQCYVSLTLQYITIKGNVTSKSCKSFRTHRKNCAQNSSLIKVLLIPQNFFHINKLSLLPWLLWQKSFWPWIFPSDVVPFQSEEILGFSGTLTKFHLNCGWKQTEISGLFLSLFFK